MGMQFMITQIKNENELNELTKENANVILQFSAKWCGPCKMVATHIEDTQKKVEDIVKIAKVDIEEVPEIAEKFGVRNIPNFIYIKNGTVVNNKTGVMTQKQMIDSVQSVFK